MPVFLSPFLSSTISLSIGWQRCFYWVRARLESGQHLLDLQIAIHDQLLIGSIQFTGLFKREQMLGPPIAHQGFADGLRVSFDVWIRSLANSAASRCPARMASTMASPVVPVMSLMTWWICRFICVSALCMCCTC